MLRHERELSVGRKRPMLDLRATRECRCTHAAGADRVHDRSESLRLRLTADRLNLLVGQRLVAAALQPCRRKKLDYVCTTGLERAHPPAKRIR